MKYMNCNNQFQSMNPKNNMCNDTKLKSENCKLLLDCINASKDFYNRNYLDDESHIINKNNCYYLIFDSKMDMNQFLNKLNKYIIDKNHEYYDIKDKLYSIENSKNDKLYYIRLHNSKFLEFMKLYFEYKNNI